MGEILNLLEHYELRTGVGLAQLGETDYLHRFSEACATAFADRNRWVGDVADVPYAELLGDGFAAERAEIMRPSSARPRPILFGWPDGDYTTARRPAQRSRSRTRGSRPRISTSWISGATRCPTR